MSSDDATTERSTEAPAKPRLFIDADAVTFNVKPYYPEGEKIVVLRPGEFLYRLRQQLVRLIS